MTIAEINASGRGRLVYTLEIAGIGVLSTYGYIPVDAWYVAAGYGALMPWLSWDALPRVREEVDPLEGRLDVGSIRLTVADIGGGFTALFKDHRARLWTRLTATLAAGAVTADVESTDGWPGAGTLYIDREVMSYAGTTATSFTGLTRGLLGTVDSEHYADPSVTTAHPQPEQPVVTDGAHFLVGRRAVLRVAPCDDDGTVGDSEVVYRGRVGRGIRAKTSGWEIPIDHLVGVLADKVATRLPSSAITPGYWYSGTGPLSEHTFITYDYSADTPAFFTATVPEGWYDAESLRTAINTAIDASGLGVVWVQLVGGAYHLHSLALAHTSVSVQIDEGSPLWALGFSQEYVQTPAAGSALSLDASDPPRLAVVDWSGREEVNPEVEVADASVFTAGLRAHPPGLPHAEVTSASGTTVVLVGGSYDAAASDQPPSKRFWAVEDAEDLVLRHTFALGAPGDEIGLLTALQRLVHLDPGQLEPERWCAAGSVDDDWDWDEWEAALTHTPAEMLRWWDALVEEIEARGVVGPALGVLGVYPRITTDGRIGAARIETPIALLAAEVPLDAEIWSLMSARDVEATLDDAPLVNAIVVRHSHRYTVESGADGDEWPSGDIQVYWDEALASLSRSRKLTYECRGWQAAGTWAVPGCTPRPSAAELAAAVSDLTVAAHFGVFGREAPTISIPCTWPSRQLRVGDLVELTHELVPDVAEGEIGVTGRLGMVMGRTYDLTGREEDQLLVRLGPANRGAGIAPCALADSWVVGTLTLSCSGWSTPLYAPAGGTDLDAFVSDVETVAVVLLERDSAVPGSWPATIAIGGADVVTGDVVLTGNPFGADPFPAGGVWIIPEEWDSRWSGHDGYCWIADHNAAPKLGAGDDDPQEWTI